MAKTLIDVNGELLSRAQEILGASTKKETVNSALREVVRRWAAQEFGELARGGVFDRLPPGDLKPTEGSCR
jgi:Arc/MetJ family transcription regulator